MDGLLRTVQDKIYKRLTTTSKRLYSPGAALNVARAGFSISQTLQVIRRADGFAICIARA